MGGVSKTVLCNWAIPWLGHPTTKTVKFSGYLGLTIHFYEVTYEEFHGFFTKRLSENVNSNKNGWICSFSLKMTSILVNGSYLNSWHNDRLYTAFWMVFWQINTCSQMNDFFSILKHPISTQKISLLCRYIKCHVRNVTSGTLPLIKICNVFFQNFL